METTAIYTAMTASRCEADRTAAKKNDRLRGEFIGRADGPTLIVVGSIHGNEPAGVRAFDRLGQALYSLTPKMKGRIYLIAGNLEAIDKRRRYIDADLNRIWTNENLSRVGTPDLDDIAEGREFAELHELFDMILITAMDEVFVIDLHSTSADGTPFLTVGDTLRNREFACKFPYLKILGIEEQLDGTMLEYLNNTGAVTLGVEGGQHEAETTVDVHADMILTAAIASGILCPSDLHAYSTSAAGRKLTANEGFAEIRYRHAIEAQDEFTMLPGFNNFDPVGRNQLLAHDRNGEIRSPETGMLLMPLYQRLGEDGFFIARRVAPFWLWLSAKLRRLGVPNIVHWLPGVRRNEDDPATLIVNTRIARIFPLQLFHLLGFRRLRWVDNYLFVSRRRHDSDGPFYWKGSFRG